MIITFIQSNVHYSHNKRSGESKKVGPITWFDPMLGSVGQHKVQTKELNKGNTYLYQWDQLSRLPLNICLHSSSYLSKLLHNFGVRGLSHNIFCVNKDKHSYIHSSLLFQLNVFSVTLTLSVAVTHFHNFSVRQLSMSFVHEC